MKHEEIKPGERYGDTRLVPVEVIGHVKGVRTERVGRRKVEVEFNKAREWMCFCDPTYGGCGNTKAIGEHLLKYGGAKSCGCLKEEWSEKVGVLGRQSPQVVVNGKTMTMKEAMQLCVVSVNEYSRRRAAGWDFERAILTPAEPPRPRGKNKSGKYEVFGEKLSMAEAVRRYGKVTRQDVYLRLAKGWSLEDALTTPRGEEPSRPGRSPP